ncbi:hypothetical protein KQI63_13645 [bacterium]|nr:hypothetical protein [bacterium]
MRVEAHTNGVQVNGPAVVIRNGALLSGLTGRPAEESNVCPKCGQSGFSCCTYSDRTELSSEALALARQPQNIGQIEQNKANDPLTAAERPVPSPNGFTPQSSQTSSHAHGESSPTSDESPHPGQPSGAVAGVSQPQESDEDSSQTGSESFNGELSEDEKKDVQEMKARDLEVRAHEQAHLAAAGSLANGGANFETERGPDGHHYAVAGDVNISFGGDTPEERLRQAEQAARAALAPAEPSGQDRAVANKANRVAAEARQEIAQQGSDEARVSMGHQPASEVEERKAGEDGEFIVPKNDEQKNAAPSTTGSNPYARVASAYQSQSIPASPSSEDSTPSLNESFTLEQAMLPGQFFAVSA